MDINLPDFVYQISNATEQPVYIVGGAVRDLLLGLEVVDFDLIAGESAIDLARELETQGLATVQSLHEPFGTAKVVWSATGQEVDLATTRIEQYSKPAVLPEVEYPVHIERDLQRRDFTINAIAIEISKQGKKSEQPLLMIDPLGGKDDLDRGAIRVLHENSYYEDPTRIVRAIRFAMRFGYQISEGDLDQIRTVLSDDQFYNFPERIRGVRFGIELRRLLELPNWLEAARYMHSLNAWDLYLQGLDFNFAKLNIEAWEFRFFWLLIDNSAAQTYTLAQNLGFKANTLKEFQQILHLKELPLDPSLKLLKLINDLSNDGRTILFSLILELENLYKRMQNVILTTTPKELMKQGYRGAAIQERLEELFQQALSQSENT